MPEHAQAKETAGEKEELPLERKPYAVFDLHCDTLTGCDPGAGGNADTLDDPKRVLRLSNLPEGVHWAQFYAIFIPDEYRGGEAIRYYEGNRDNFFRQMRKFSSRVRFCRTCGDVEEAFRAGQTAAFLTVENGSVLAGDLERVPLLARDGVKAVTLTWNGENEIGSGHQSQHGLTSFGKRVIPELEKYGIVVDVSHLNDAGFMDVLEVARRPFAATHSNARAVAAHRRKLTDGMIREMVRRGCLVGLNYFVAFLREDGKVESLDDLYRHVEHFLSLGAEHCLALGSDFDGAELPQCLNSPEKAAGIYEYLLGRGLPERTVSGILYQNALDFLRRSEGPA